MSLDNVFMGKKVVQQIYLKNALIYQSKGWETLPSAPQVEWTKNYGSTATVTDCAVDQNNNIYVAAGNILYKINADGVLAWKHYFSCVGGMRICIDQNNNIYVATPDTSNAQIQRLDTNGNVLVTGNTYNEIDLLSDVIVDNNNLYLAGSSISPKNYYIYVFDKDLNKIQSGTFEADALLMISNDSPYIFFAQGHNLVQIEKSKISSAYYHDINTINNNLPYDSTWSSAKILRLTMDNLGNIFYLTDGLGLYKYNFNTKNTTKAADSSNARGDLCIDYQQNIYCIKFDTPGSAPYSVNLIKTSLDGTLIYNTQIVKNDDYDGLLNSALVADNNGNIYFIYRNYNRDLLITKIINLVKKGN